jgi:valyl-tRNA synthetase
MLPEDHETTAVLLGNRSAALVSLERWERVIQDTSGAIFLNPNHMKCYVRRAKAYEREQNYSAAFDDWKKAAELDPQLRDAQQALLRLPPLVKEQQEREKEQMLGQLKDLGNKFLGMFGLSLDNFKMEQDSSTGSYKMNFNK